MRALAITQNITLDGSIEMLGDWFDPQGQGGTDNTDLLEEMHRQDSRADALGSIANYLSRNGWREPAPWGFEVATPAELDLSGLDHRVLRPAREWARAGVRRTDGRPLPSLEGEWAVVTPGHSRGDSQSFLVGANFMAIRRYNPSNFYATAVGLLSDRVG